MLNGGEDFFVDPVMPLVQFLAASVRPDIGKFLNLRPLDEILVEVGVLDITFVSVVGVLLVIDFFVIVRLYFGEAESDIHTVLIEGAVVYHLTSAFAGEFLYDFLALLPPLLMFGGVDVERLLPVVEKDGPSTLQDCFQRVLANAKAFCLGVKVLGPWNRFTLLNFL